MIFYLFIFLTLCGVVLLIWGLMVRLPDNSQRDTSTVLGDGTSSAFGKAFAPLLAQNPDKSGLLMLEDGLDAFVARIALVRQAQISLDVQYYMFRHDLVGRLLIKELLDAADRGVRVRLLIDDIYGEDGDYIWATMVTHPNISVRLYNPFVRGYVKALQFITDLMRINHRMHSKTFTADNQITILGGRNIGDEYFDATSELAFADLDALVIGAVVPTVSKQFDEYWNNRHSYPVTTLIAGVAGKELPVGALAALQAELEAKSKSRDTEAYRNAVSTSPLAIALREKTVAFSFSEADIIHDSAEKLTRIRKTWQDDLMFAKLAPYIRQAKTDLTLISPYFVPGHKGADAICKLRANGVRVRILTNSLSSNDVAAVHTGYIRHRKQLLRCGVEIYELNEKIKKDQGARFKWLRGLEKSSLHAKTLVIDKRVMYVGSFNFDQRSLNLNTEIGIVFEDAEIAGHAVELFDENISMAAFRVELVGDTNRNGKLRWTGVEDGETVVFYKEPYASLFRRVSTQLMRLLPIDSFL
ncbi:MAG: phospholipase D family protein [Proteobacteria bacterium]|nr:phospholipase D family protein [Pseudomonadota bacterium]